MSYLFFAWVATLIFGLETVIGKITREPGLLLHDRNGVKTLTAHGYTHFAKS